MQTGVVAALASSGGSDSARPSIMQKKKKKKKKNDRLHISLFAKCCCLSSIQQCPNTSPFRFAWRANTMRRNPIHDFGLAEQSAASELHRKYIYVYHRTKLKSKKKKIYENVLVFTKQQLTMSKQKKNGVPFVLRKRRCGDLAPITFWTILCMFASEMLDACFVTTQCKL